MPPRRLLLFDIDGTLINTNGAGSRAMLAALEVLFNRPFSRAGVVFAGRTDPQIIQDLLLANGLPVDSLDEVIRAVFEIFPEHLRQVAQDHPPRQLPGIALLLSALRQEPAFGLGLVTGNNRAGAQAKLTLAGLDFSWFQFGAFGSDAHNRNDLPPLALLRAEAVYGRRFLPQEALVIGDTPADIECGHVNHIPVLAVATGGHSLSALAAHAPEYLLPDLSDLPAVLRLLSG